MTHLLRTLKRALPPAALLFGLMAGTPALAQGTGSVDTYGFTPSSGAFVPVAPTAAAVPILLGDDIAGPLVPLNFTFNFDGANYTQVSASSNGVLFFGAASTAFTNDIANGFAANRPFVAPYWDDLDGRTTGADARYATTGTAPNRVFTFQWLNWNRYNNSGGQAAFSFQVKLYETTNVVQCVYRLESGSVVGTPSASIGLGGVGAGPGSFLSLSDAGATPTASSTAASDAIGALPVTGQGYTFTPTTPPTCPAPRSIFFSNVTGTGATLNFRGSPSATNYTAIVTPAGGPAQAPVTATASPVILTGLTPNTTYSVAVTSNCAAGATTTATTTFTTTGPYCLGTGTLGLGGNCGSNNVTAVRLAGTTLNATGLTCNTSGTSTYTNSPASGPTTATLSGGVPYQLSVTQSGVGESIISAWLDSNRDNVFDATEWVQVATNAVSGQAATCTLFVPTTATPGLTGLRIRSRAAGNSNAAPDACANFGSGETKDFTITIGSPAACPSVGDPSIGSVTTTGAILSFTPISTATGGYTVTLTPVGGAALPPITTTTSPINLTGLVPNTRYDVNLVSNCSASLVSAAITTSFTTLPTPPANDNCVTATALPVTADCTSPTAGTVLAATQQQAPTANCGTATVANDVWFAFTATGINHALTVTGQFAGVVEVRSGTCTASTSVFCTTFAAGGAGSSNIVGGLTIGQSYFIRLYATATPAPTASAFTVCVTPGPPPPANDECAQAIVLPISTTCVTPLTGTVAAASQSQGPTANCGFGLTQANDVWYSFVANGTSQGLTFAPQFNGVVDVRSGTCTTSASIYCGTTLGGSQLIASVAGLTSGQTYYMRVYASTAANPAGAGANFTLCLTAGSAPPPNDECAGALNVPVQATCSAPTVSTNVGASPSAGVPAPTCVPNGYQGGDIWFAVTVPANGTVTVSAVTPAGGSVVTDTQLSVYSGACTNLIELGCNDNAPQGSGALSQLTINGRTPGEVLYARVYSYNNTTTGPIAVCATSPNAGPCPPPTNLTITTNSTTATLNFSPSSAATTYTITIQRQGNPNVVTLPPATANSVPLTGLVAGAAYTVSITSNCPGGISSAVAKVTFATVTPCPAATNLLFNNVTATTARLAFTPVVAAVSYTLTLTPAGGTATTITVAGSPLDLTGLQPGVTYAVGLVSNCGPGRASAPAPGSFTTLTSYCIANLGGACATHDITDVSIVGTVLTATGLTCTAAVGTQAYTAYPAGGNTTATLPRGASYAVSVTTATPSIVALWLDSNRNLTFDTGEFVQVALASTANQPTTVNVPVGPNATPGPASLRIRSRALNTLNGPADACTNFGATGETKDFTVSIAFGLATRSAAESAALQVYPNPSNTGQLTLRLDGNASHTGTAILYNVLGQAVVQQTLSGAAEQVLDVRPLPTGIYTLRLRLTTGQTLTRKVVLE